MLYDNVGREVYIKIQKRKINFRIIQQKNTVKENDELREK